MVLLGLVCALVSAVGAVFGWVAWTGRQTATIAIPADTAAPLDVARAYVAAINAHDCHAARSVTVADSVDMTTTWCTDVRSLAVSEWRTPLVESSGYYGRTAPQEVTYVPVSMTVAWRPFHDDGSMSSAGVITWGYVLVRENAGAPWRVADQGVG